jgi:hypothetical protein
LYSNDGYILYKESEPAREEMRGVLKDRIAFRVAAVLFFALLTTPVFGTFAQTITTAPMPSKVPELPKVNLPELDLLQPPDLVIESLEIETGKGAKHGDETWYPFSLGVKNIGKLPVTDHFYIVFERDFGGQGSWEPDRERSNAIRIDKPILPDQAIGVSGHLKLRISQVSERTVVVRALVDSAVFEEFPPPDGYIRELNENNNSSNAVTIQGRYQPNLTGISIDRALKGADEVIITGSGFGSQDPGRTVLLLKDSQKLPAEITRWTEHSIGFQVPVSAQLGYTRACIGSSDTLFPVSNSQGLIVLGSLELPWVDLLDAFNIFMRTFFSIRLHTWTGSSNYENISAMEVYGQEDPFPLEVPLVQLDTDVGHYRFLINDLNSARGIEWGFSMNRNNCEDNQFRLVIDFESEGYELIGYYKVLGPAGKWDRTGAPDVDVDKVSVEVLFRLRDAGGGRLDYDAGAIFKGDVSASGPVWNSILNTFQKGWRDDIEKEVGLSVRIGVNEQQTRYQICSSFVTSIRQLLKMKDNEKISGYNFTSNGIQVLYY